MRLNISRIAFIGDIHGYAPALEIAIERCQAEGIDALIGLGDYVDGYDADEECVSLVKQHFTACVRGNHDEDHGPQLEPETAQWLAGLTETTVFDEWLVTHSSPRPARAGEYIRNSLEAWNCFDDCEFSRCIVGHTHQPMLYKFPGDHQFDSTPLDATGEGIILDPNHRYLVVNPSLAYNRTGQANPGFSIFDNDSQRLRFVYLDLPQIDRTPRS